MSWFADKCKDIIAEKRASAIRVQHPYRNMPPSPCSHFRSMSYFRSILCSFYNMSTSIFLFLTQFFLSRLLYWRFERNISYIVNDKWGPERRSPPPPRLFPKTDPGGTIQKIKTSPNTKAGALFRKRGPQAGAPPPPQALSEARSDGTYRNNKYFRNPWSVVLLEKPTGFQLVKKFPAFYGIRRFITAVTSACHLSLSWASSKSTK